MDRRGVLKGLGMAFAASLWPGWVREASAAPRNGLLEGAATLISAIERARLRLQPLLVLVIPEDDRAKYFRGRHFGEWLNHGDDADLAPLACAEVACAGMDVLRALLPGAPAAGEPAILMLEADPSLRLGVVLSDFPHRDLTVEEELTSGDQRFGEGEAEITACVRATGTAVRSAVLGDLDEVKRRAQGRWRQLTSEARAEVRRIYDGVDASQEAVLAAAPLLAVDAVDKRGNARALGLLARAARVRYCGQSIPGSEWAQTEDDGQVPARSRRFLYFPTRTWTGDS